MQVADGAVVTLEYTVHLADGTLLDSTGDCGPLAVMIGSGQLFPALEERHPRHGGGRDADLTIPPATPMASGVPSWCGRMPRDRLPPDLDLEVGREYRLKSPDGKRAPLSPARDRRRRGAGGLQPPQAGQALSATVTVVGVRAPTPDEERRGRT